MEHPTSVPRACNLQMLQLFTGSVRCGNLVPWRMRFFQARASFIYLPVCAQHPALYLAHSKHSINGCRNPNYPLHSHSRCPSFKLYHLSPALLQELAQWPWPSLPFPKHQPHSQHNYIWKASPGISYDRKQTWRLTRSLFPSTSILSHLLFPPSRNGHPMPQLPWTITGPWMCSVLSNVHLWVEEPLFGSLLLMLQNSAPIKSLLPRRS